MKPVVWGKGVKGIRPRPTSVAEKRKDRVVNQSELVERWMRRYEEVEGGWRRTMSEMSEMKRI